MVAQSNAQPATTSQQAQQAPTPRPLTPPPTQPQQLKAAIDPTKTPSRPIIQAAPFTIQPIGAREPYIKILVYGNPGAGKTTLTNSAVDCDSMRDVLFVDAEKGETAVKDNPRIKHADMISHIPVAEFKQVAYIHEFMKAHCLHRDKPSTDEAATQKLRELESKVTGVPADDIDEPRRYRTVILDPLTEINELCLSKLKGLESANLLGDPNDLVKAGWDEYNKNLDMMKMLVRAFRDLPVHLLLCCSLTYTEDEVKRKFYGPALTGQLPRSIMGMVDIVGYMVSANETNEKGERDRRMFIQPGQNAGARYHAKNRRALFKGDFWDNPSMEMIMRDTGMIK